MKQYIRKADIILLIALVALGLGTTALLTRLGGTANSSHVVIKSGGAVYARYPMDKDAAYVIPAPSGTAYSSPRPQPLSGDDDCTQYTYYNIVKIESGEVSVSAASCKNQVCVRHGSISRIGESIVCLPNRLIVSIEGETEGGGYDSVTS